MRNEISKFALITDTHYEYQNFPESEREILTQNFFNHVNEKHIKTVIHLGDVYNECQIFENRSETIFFDLIDDNNDIDFYIICGNHDLPENGYLDKTFVEKDNLKIIHQKEIIDDCLFLPSMNRNKPENDFIFSASDYKYVFAHYEDSMEKNVFSGHKHKRKNSFIGSFYPSSLDENKHDCGYVFVDGDITYFNNKISHWQTILDNMPHEYYELGSKNFNEIEISHYRKKLIMWMGWYDKTIDTINYEQKIELDRIMMLIETIDSNDIENFLTENRIPNTLR